ncbi:hypothetical protein GR925_07290 [Streptomyces sp. HUCO-GS316]|uniref:hypothetical protein n=1 Tax=Streptomyces sp. HUCO-GS316 TaxID=2692198 RepID=UPI00136D5EDC|nr:hypothetical protein [Streptomyces sp. HUCO-GS316]MXM63258.1 hypothetical protein [Streptomyces sp. HUCO-GS316]
MEQTRRGTDGSEGPVFVDESGRRSRTFRRIGIAVGFACAVYAVVIVATLLSGNSHAPWLPVPGQNADRPADSVDTSPRPPAREQPSAGAAPGTAPTAAGATTPRPDTSSARPGALTGPDRPSMSASPSPTSARTVPGPGTGPAGPSPEQTPTQGSPSPDPSASADGGSASPDPSPSGGGVDPGLGPVANGGADPMPIAVSPAGDRSTSAAPASPSPEPVL